MRPAFSSSTNKRPTAALPPDARRNSETGCSVISVSLHSFHFTICRSIMRFNSGDLDHSTLPTCGTTPRSSLCVANSSLSLRWPTSPSQLRARERRRLARCRGCPTVQCFLIAMLGHAALKIGPHQSHDRSARLGDDGLKGAARRPPQHSVAQTPHQSDNQRQPFGCIHLLKV